MTYRGYIPPTPGQVIETMRQALQACEKLQALDSLYVDWVGYSPLQDSPESHTFESLRGDMCDYLREVSSSMGVQYIPFPWEIFAPGQIVRFSEVIEPGDENLRFKVIEFRDTRVLVELITTVMHLKPQFVYPLSMLVAE